MVESQNDNGLKPDDSGDAFLILHGGPSGRPFFLVSPGSGKVYERVANLMSLDCPVIAIQDPLPLTDYRRGLQLLPFSERVSLGCRVIRRFQPSGPYRIAGWDYGGLIAYEIASRLERESEEVKFLGLIDSYPYTRVGRAGSSGVRFPSVRSAINLAYRLRSLPRYLRDAVWIRSERWRRPSAGLELFPTVHEYGAFVAEEFRRHSRLDSAGYFAMRFEGDVRSLVEDVNVRREMRTLIASRAARREYLPSAYSGPLNLFVQGGRRRKITDPANADFGWAEFCSGEISIRSIDVNHTALLRPRHADALAVKLAEALAEA